MSELSHESTASLPPVKPEVEVTSKGAKKMRVLSDTLIAYKLVWFRVGCYFFIPAGLLFLTQTETWSGETWEATHAFLKNRLYLACIICGSNSLCAYVDSSFQRAKEAAAGMKVEREVDANKETAFLRKKDL